MEVHDNQSIDQLLMVGLCPRRNTLNEEFYTFRDSKITTKRCLCDVCKSRTVQLAKQKNVEIRNRKVRVRPVEVKGMSPYNDVL